MERKLVLADSGRKNGSYLRKELKKDVLYGFYRHKQVNIVFAKKSGAPTSVTDSFVRQLQKGGYITPEQAQLCEQTIRQRFETVDLVESYDQVSLESLYDIVQDIRRETLGADAICQAQLDGARQPLQFQPESIDQSAKKEQSLQSCDAVILALCQAELASLLLSDLQKAKGKDVYILVNPESGYDLPDVQVMQALVENQQVHFLHANSQGIAYDEKLQQQIDGGKALLLVYGEDGLLFCRDLMIDAVVYAIPRGYYAQAMTNQLGTVKPCVVFVPKHFDITNWVRLRERTRLSYWQLAKLQQACGDSIYACSPQQLYEKHPEYFINIYQNGADFIPSPVTIKLPEGGDVMAQFDLCREQAIEGYLNSFDNLQYYAAYFDEHLQQQPISTDSSQKQPGILVHGVRVKKAQASRVIRCGKNVTLRQMFEGSETGIVSNFLFFMTPKLATLYNDLRKDRPYEQADVATGHLDYMLAYRDGKRIETFPLFRKTCIAMKENGEFIFFNFRLGGGSVQAGNHTLRWEADCVDTAKDAPVQVFTPYYSLPDKDADRQTYRKAVGQDRVNLVILQDRICSIRKGDVILPSVGAVISLTPAMAEPILQELPYLEDGYYDVSGLELTVQLDPPAQVDPQTWAQVRWAYGGGLSLILNGVGLCDGDHMEAWFEADGWKSPLSRQTQESTLHELVKHPRTAIGTLPNGDLIILVFSGRTWRSTGANYDEMCQIARKLFGDVDYLMNMDGGGSAVLGMVTDGSFMELSCPSTSTGSCVGMVRPINTVLYIPAE